MNRKNTLIVVFMVIGALVVSAFSLVAITNENNAASLQRGRSADAARYTAMAKFYTGQASPAANLSWPPRPDFSIPDQQAIILVTGGANGLEIYYSSERGTYVAPRSGLDIYHQSEWNAAKISTFHDIESARWMGAALASQVQGVVFHYTSPGR